MRIANRGREPPVGERDKSRNRYGGLTLPDFLYPKAAKRSKFRTEVLARIPNPNTSQPHFVVVSDVAALDFVTNDETLVPVLKVAQLEPILDMSNLRSLTIKFESDPSDFTPRDYFRMPPRVDELATYVFTD